MLQKTRTLISDLALLKYGNLRITVVALWFCCQANSKAPNVGHVFPYATCNNHSRLLFSLWTDPLWSWCYSLEKFNCRGWCVVLSAVHKVHKGRTPLFLPCPISTSVLLLFNLVYLSSFLLKKLSTVWARVCPVTFVSLDVCNSLLRLLGHVLNNLAGKTGDKKYRKLLRNRCEL